MKILVIFLLVTLLFVFATSTAFAANTDSFTLYLPVIFKAVQIGIVTPAAAPDFKVDSIRLWDVTENGGQQAPALQCGDHHTLQVHVFDANGDHGEQSRLNGVIVRVVQMDEQGQTSEEARSTGLPGVGPGVVEFALKRNTTVMVSYDMAGHAATSAQANVSTAPAEIPAVRLIASGYCAEVDSCAALVQTNTCRGKFSWNVVFIRNARAGQSQ